KTARVASARRCAAVQFVELDILIAWFPRDFKSIVSADGAQTSTRASAPGPRQGGKPDLHPTARSICGPQPESPLPFAPPPRRRELALLRQQPGPYGGGRLIGV
ncbi:MAG: hypothetical protein ACK5ZA_16580, partial [Betaproteobacteria bacterium]